MDRIALSLVICCLAACSHMSPAGSEIAELAGLMVGDFETAPDVAESRFVDQRRRLAALGDGEWVYMQLNSGPDGRLYRQRVLQLTRERDGVVRQRTYRLTADGDRRDLIADPERLAALTRGDLDMSADMDCANFWRRGSGDSIWLWQGRVDPGKCIIFSERRQARIAIGAEAYLKHDALWLAERGFDLEGQLLWGSPLGEYSQLHRSPTLR